MCNETFKYVKSICKLLCTIFIYKGAMLYICHLHKVVATVAASSRENRSNNMGTLQMLISVAAERNTNVNNLIKL